MRGSAVLGAVRRSAEAHPLTSGGEAERRINSFDALRLLAACAVLVSHCFALAGERQPAIGSIDLGTVAVWVFFAISGFLIAQSWVIEPRLWRYLAKRALRIMPALLVVLLLTVLVLGPLYTSLPLADYFADARTWGYLLENAVLLTAGELPGVFTDNPYPGQVNGSLWTLAPEVWAYAGLAAVGLAGGLRRPWVPAAVVLLLAAVPHDPTGTLPWPKEIWLLQTFAVGTCLFVLRDRIPWRGTIAAVLTALFLLVSRTSLQLDLAPFLLPYVAIHLAYRGPRALRRLTARGDFSYGIYLYAWPVGQAVAASWSGIGPAALIAVSLPLTYLLAVASWRVVERPALSLKRSLPLRSSEPRAEGATEAEAERATAARFVRARIPLATQNGSRDRG